MTQYTTSEARKNLTDIINQVSYGGKRIAITCRHKSRVVLISAEDAELLELLEDRMDVAAARKALKEKEPDIPWKEVKKKLAAKRSRRSSHKK